mmetsp:Transcript_14802/g.40510  ORF Transcript_14802/g.40510 Transcript_14802/m.40510 type:complete len:355 (-) Transcript_14802:138-1202(-)
MVSSWSWIAYWCSLIMRTSCSVTPPSWCPPAAEARGSLPICSCWITLSRSSTAACSSRILRCSCWCWWKLAALRCASSWCTCSLSWSMSASWFLLISRSRCSSKRSSPPLRSVMLAILALSALCSDSTSGMIRCASASSCSFWLSRDCSWLLARRRSSISRVSAAMCRCGSPPACSPPPPSPRPPRRSSSCRRRFSSRRACTSLYPPSMSRSREPSALPRPVSRRMRLTSSCSSFRLSTSHSWVSSSTAVAWWSRLSLARRSASADMRSLCFRVVTLATSASTNCQSWEAFRKYAGSTNASGEVSGDRIYDRMLPIAAASRILDDSPGTFLGSMFMSDLSKVEDSYDCCDSIAR